jgi:hypothetical protein
VTPARIINGQPNLADDSALATAGLQKWSLESDGNWHLLHVLQNGLKSACRTALRTTPRTRSGNGRLQKPDRARERRRNSGSVCDHLDDQREWRSGRRPEPAGDGERPACCDFAAGRQRSGTRHLYDAPHRTGGGSFARHCVCAGAVGSLVSNEESGDALPAKSSMANPLARVVGCCNVARRRERLCAPGHRAPFPMRTGEDFLRKGRIFPVDHSGSDTNSPRNWGSSLVDEAGWPGSDVCRDPAHGRRTRVEP